MRMCHLLQRLQQVAEELGFRLKEFPDSKAVLCEMRGALGASADLRPRLVLQELTHTRIWGVRHTHNVLGERVKFDVRRVL